MPTIDVTAVPARKGSGYPVRRVSIGPGRFLIKLS
jgi:hypothetical protein